MAAHVNGPLPPFHLVEGFLGEAEHQALLDWTIANQARFKPSTLIGGVLDPEMRISVRLRDLGPHSSVFSERIAEHLPLIFAGTGVPPFPIDYLELEVAAHGDGAFYRAHRDLPIGDARRALSSEGALDRIVSTVFYYFREPRRFSGGELRLYRFGADGEPGDYVDILPDQNRLVAFPSWVMHEVRPVSCPGGAFEDYRFAVNCWLCRNVVSAGA